MYGQQQQQQSQLPADPAQQRFNTEFVDYNNPAPIPQYHGSPEVQQWLSAISTMAVLEIQNNMTRNPLRMFMFNYYVQNRFANDQHFRLVANIADWFDMEMSSGQFQDPQLCLQTIVPRMVEMTTCCQLNQHRELANYIQDQNLFNHCQRMAQNFEELGRAISQFQETRQRNQYRGQFDRPQYGHQQQNGGGSWASAQMGGGQPMTTDPWNAQSNGFSQRQPVQTHSTGTSSLFSERPAQPQQQQYQDSPQQLSRYAMRQRMLDEQRAEAEPVQVQQFTAAVDTRRVYEQPEDVTWRSVAPDERLFADCEEVDFTKPYPHSTGNAQDMQDVETRESASDDLYESLIHADSSPYKWVPSQRQPYPLLYTPATQLLYHHVMADGKVMEVVKPRVKGSMDYEKHRVPTWTGPQPRKFKQEHADAEMERMMKVYQTPKDTELPDVEANEAALLENRVFETAPVLETNLEDALVVCQLGRLASVEEGVVTDVYHRRAKIAQVVLGDEDQSRYLERLAECDSYEDAHATLTGLGEVMSPDLWQLCEHKLTSAVNRVMRTQLSIPPAELCITSFSEDILALVPLLRKRFGDFVAESFLMTAETTIRTSFSTFSEVYDDHRAVLTENYMLEYQLRLTKPPMFTYLASDVTITTLSCASAAIGIELRDDRAVMITTAHPFLYKLAQDIRGRVRDDIKTSDGLDEEPEFEHHYIRTSDGKLLELSVGVVGGDSFLLSKAS